MEHLFGTDGSGYSGAAKEPEVTNCASVRPISEYWTEQRFKKPRPSAALDFLFAAPWTSANDLRDRNSWHRCHLNATRCRNVCRSKALVGWGFESAANPSNGQGYFSARRVRVAAAKFSVSLHQRNFKPRQWR